MSSTTPWGTPWWPIQLLGLILVHNSCLLSMYYVPGRHCATCSQEPYKAHSMIPLLLLQWKKFVHRKEGHKPDWSRNENCSQPVLKSLCSYWQPCLLRELAQPVPHRLPLTLCPCLIYLSMECAPLPQPFPLLGDTEFFPAFWWGLQDGKIIGS